jgi:hypothetical protein
MFAVMWRSKSSFFCGSRPFRTPTIIMERVPSTLNFLPTSLHLQSAPLAQPWIIKPFNQDGYNQTLDISFIVLAIDQLTDCRYRPNAYSAELSLVQDFNDFRSQPSRLLPLLSSALCTSNCLLVHFKGSQTLYLSFMSVARFLNHHLMRCIKIRLCCVES